MFVATTPDFGSRSRLGNEMSNRLRRHVPSEAHPRHTPPPVDFPKHGCAMKRIHPPIWALSIAAIAIPLLAMAQDFEIVSPPNAWNTTPLGIRNGKVYGKYQDLTDAKIRGFT